MEPLYIVFGIGVAVGAYLASGRTTTQDKPSQLENIISKEKPSAIPGIEMATY